MKFALQKLPNGKTQIVDASGNPLGSGDAARPILHILPKLWAPAEIIGHPSKRFHDGLMCEEVTLTVTSSLPIDVMPEGGIEIRQPYPIDIFVTHDIHQSLACFQQAVMMQDRC